MGYNRSVKYRVCRPWSSLLTAHTLQEHDFSPGVPVPPCCTSEQPPVIVSLDVRGFGGVIVLGNGDEGRVGWDGNPVLRELPSSEGQGEKQRPRIPISSPKSRLSKSPYTWVCLYLPRIIQTPPDVLQTLYPLRVPQTISPIASQPPLTLIPQKSMDCFTNPLPNPIFSQTPLLLPQY